MDDEKMVVVIVWALTVDGVMMCKECGKGWKRVKGEWFNHCPYCGVRLDGGRRGE